MSYYIFEHPKTKERIEVKQAMDDPHQYEEDGVCWNRIFTVVNASVDSQIDPMSSQDFADKTGRKRGSLGDILDCSKECAEKREEMMGHDPVKAKWFKDYSSLRHGKKHPDQRNQEILDKIKKNKRLQVE